MVNVTPNNVAAALQQPVTNADVKGATTAPVLLMQDPGSDKSEISEEVTCSSALSEVQPVIKVEPSSVDSNKKDTATLMELENQQCQSICDITGSDECFASAEESKRLQSEGIKNVICEEVNTGDKKGKSQVQRFGDTSTSTAVIGNEAVEMSKMDDQVESTDLYDEKTTENISNSVLNSHSTEIKKEENGTAEMNDEKLEDHEVTASDQSYPAFFPSSDVCNEVEIGANEEVVQSSSSESGGESENESDRKEITKAPELNKNASDSGSVNGVMNQSISKVGESETKLSKNMIDSNSSVTNTPVNLSSRLVHSSVYYLFNLMFASRYCFIFVCL